MSKPSRGPLKQGAIFLDRDGVINACPVHRYITRWEEFRFLPGVLDSLKALHHKREKVFVVSNQSAVGRGLLKSSRLKQITRWMLAQVRHHGGEIHQVYYCVHRSEGGCPCRKPRDGMLRKAARQFRIDLSRSFIVGDQETDLLMGRSSGCRTILVLSGKHNRKSAKTLSVHPDRIVRGLPEAVRWILSQKGKGP